MRSIIYNDRGRAPIDPCSAFCGPVDVASWHRAVRRELEIASRAAGSGLLSVYSLRDFVAAYQSIRLDPASSPGAAITWRETVARYAHLAQLTRNHWWEAVEKTTTPVEVLPGSENIWRQFWSGGGIDAAVTPNLPATIGAMKAAAATGVVGVAMWQLGIPLIVFLVINAQGRRR